MNAESLRKRFDSTVYGVEYETAKIWNRILNVHTEEKFPDLTYIATSFDIFRKLRIGMRSDPAAFEWALWLQHLALDYSLPDYGARKSAECARTIMRSINVSPRLVQRTSALIRSRDPTREIVNRRDGLLRDIHHYSAFAFSVDRAVQSSLNMGKQQNGTVEQRTELIGAMLSKIKARSVYRHPYLRAYELIRTTNNITVVQTNLRYLF